jgi:ABC-type nitrate/sulfonate/bicarbonate transport system substrate-binding protein
VLNRESHLPPVDLARTPPRLWAHPGLDRPASGGGRARLGVAVNMMLLAKVKFWAFSSFVPFSERVWMATKVTVALDWTPNTNHIGFYVAKARGWYTDAGLDVTLLSPHHDDYKATPASRVAHGTATFAVTPSETVVSSHTQPPGLGKPALVAVAALQCRSTDAVVTLKSSGRDTPAKLEGANYASYGARYEGRIVQELIKAGGGSGVYTETVPPMLGIWNTLLAGKADATWVFMGATRVATWSDQIK